MLNCGHAMHEVCFKAAYTTLFSEIDAPYKCIGVCGIRQRLMQLGKDYLSDRNSDEFGLLPETQNRDNGSSGGVPNSEVNVPQSQDAFDEVLPGCSYIPRGNSSPSHLLVERDPLIQAEYQTQLLPTDRPLTVSSAQTLVRSSRWNHASTSTLVGSETHEKLEENQSNQEKGGESEEALLEVIMEDLFARIIDWNEISIPILGTHRMYGHLQARVHNKVQKVYAYLFSRVLICARLVEGGPDPLVPEFARIRAPLKLKGRVFLSEVWKITETGDADEISLTICLKNEELDRFMLIFNERRTLDAWKSKILELVVLKQ